MRILIAEDDPISAKLLETTLTKWNFQVECVQNGRQALRVLCGSNPPSIAILDWMMPEMTGPEVCQKVRTMGIAHPPYVILLTARTEKEDLIQGLEAGADDYMIKPFDRGELKARLQVGQRILKLQTNLNDRIQEFHDAMAQVEYLQSLLPLCWQCKKKRDDEDYWFKLHTFFDENADLNFPHSSCPECKKKNLVKEVSLLSL